MFLLEIHLHYLVDGKKLIMFLLFLFHSVQCNNIHLRFFFLLYFYFKVDSYIHFITGFYAIDGDDDNNHDVFCGGRVMIKSL